MYTEISHFLLLHAISQEILRFLCLATLWALWLAFPKATLKKLRTNSPTGGNGLTPQCSPMQATLTLRRSRRSTSLGGGASAYSPLGGEACVKRRAGLPSQRGVPTPSATAPPTIRYARISPVTRSILGAPAAQKGLVHPELTHLCTIKNSYLPVLKDALILCPVVSKDPAGAFGPTVPVHYLEKVSTISTLLFARANLGHRQLPLPLAGCAEPVAIGKGRCRRRVSSPGAIANAGGLHRSVHPGGPSSLPSLSASPPSPKRGGESTSLWGGASAGKPSPKIRQIRQVRQDPKDLRLRRRRASDDPYPTGIGVRKDLMKGKSNHRCLSSQPLSLEESVCWSAFGRPTMVTERKRSPFFQVWSEATQTQMIRQYYFCVPQERRTFEPIIPGESGSAITHIAPKGSDFCRSVRISIFFLILTSCFFGTITNYVCSDFSIYNILTNSTADVPLFYKISATWSNHEGSLLLWCWLLSFNAFLFCVSICTTQFVRFSSSGTSLLFFSIDQSVVTYANRKMYKAAGANAPMFRFRKYSEIN